MTKLSKEELIQMLNLIPLPLEGGKFAQTYSGPVSADNIPSDTAIYYMLEGDDFSHLHRLPRNELYHFYLGDPIELIELLPNGEIRKTILGQDLSKGQKVQHMVNAGNWQGSHLVSGGYYALIGTTMCPGYTPDCYEQGNRTSLISEYPQAREDIIRLTTFEQQ